MTAATLRWTCLTPGCDAHGTTTGTESGADAKHCREQTHATNAHARDWLADDGLAGMGAGL